MGENSKIEWTTHTFNPWWGCTKVAAGCTNCYAEALSKRTGRAKWGNNGIRMRTSRSNWRQPIKWNREAEQAGVRERVFCASMADVFEDWKGAIEGSGIDDDTLAIDDDRSRLLTMDDMRAELFKLIDATPHLDWLLLTKRPENIRRMWKMVVEAQLPDIDPGEWYRPNVWLGASIATQADADRNIPLLLECRYLAPVLFLSIEPMVEAVDLARWIPADKANWQCQKCGSFQRDDTYCLHCKADAAYLSGSHVANKRAPGTFTGWTNSQPIDWVIVGGESGHGARPCHPDWVRSIRDQCKSAGVPFFWKQWGEHVMPSQMTDATYASVDNSVNLAGLREEFYRVGKKAAGRLLDGVEYSEFPEVNHG